MKLKWNDVLAKTFQNNMLLKITFLDLKFHITGIANIVKNLFKQDIAKIKI